MFNTIDNFDPVRWAPSRPRQTPSLLRALRRWVAQHRPQRALHDELVELDAHTLADIGAPDDVLDRAMARRELQRQEREGLRIGLAAGAWHHW